jgi:hypothetical protein
VNWTGPIESSPQSALKPDFVGADAIIRWIRCGKKCHFLEQKNCLISFFQDLHASNHAILQSLIVHQRKLDNHHRRHQIDANFGFHTPPSFADDSVAPPPVCCASAKFDSLTILYFDENDNVVLKNYPRMIVLECGCI